MDAGPSVKRRYGEARIIGESQFSHIAAVVPGLLNGILQKRGAGFFDRGNAGRKWLQGPPLDFAECGLDLDHFSRIGCRENETIHFERMFRWASISSWMPRRPRPSNSVSLSVPKGSRSAVP